LGISTGVFFVGISEPGNLVSFSMACAAGNLLWPSATRRVP
jgi:hypothetical protein